MPANIAKRADGRPMMMYTGEEPWWGGKDVGVKEALTSEQALIAAGLDWDVEKRAVYTKDPNAQGHVSKYTEAPGWNAVTRVTDGKVFGLVSERYEVIQNRDAFSFLDSLAQDRTLQFETAGMTGEDSRTAGRVWMLARLDGDMRILDDVYSRYLLGVTAHSGWHSFQPYATFTRVVCENTLNMAVSADTLTSIRHTGDVAGKMAAARAMLQITTDEQRKMQEFLTKAATVEVTEDDLTKVQEKLFGALDEATPAQRRTAIDSFIAIYREEVEHNGENAYSLTNAVTGFADHKIRIKKDSDRLTSVLTGQGMTFKTKGLKVIGNLVTDAVGV